MVILEMSGQKIFKSEWLITTSSKENMVFMDEGDYMKRLVDGQKIITRYFDKYVKNKPAPLQVELRFTKKDKVIIGKHYLVGAIDQIDNSQRVIDLKTGSKVAQAQLDLDLQFTIYSYAYRKLFNKEESGLVLRHLGSCTDLITKRTESDFKILDAELEKMEAAIKKGVFVRNLGRNCSTCYFLEVCLGKERAQPIRAWKPKKKCQFW
jgi:CRISPR/Cas system-associated exonuclease Cas4 (RecB family)